MFDLFGRSQRLDLAEMMKNIPAQPMYTSTPVLREQCSCGGYTEIVAHDEARTEAHFVKWRRDHACKPSAKRAAPAASPETAT